MRKVINNITVLGLWLSPALLPGHDSLLDNEPPYRPVVTTIFHKIGESTYTIKVQQYGEKTGLVFVNLHDDEITSVNATKKILENEGGILIEIENRKQRNLKFRLGRTYYIVDPNRIFSKEGMTKSMSEFGRNSTRAAEEIEKFADRILQLIPENADCVIALHNNTPGLFGADSYTPGNGRAKEASKVFINPEQDDDDFYLTTDSYLYESLSNKNFNTILQDNNNCTEDGSLSVYCGKRNIRYVNLETEHGKTDQYYTMMKALLEILSSKTQ